MAVLVACGDVFDGEFLPSVVANEYESSDGLTLYFTDTWEIRHRSFTAISDLEEFGNNSGWGVITVSSLYQVACPANSIICSPGTRPPTTSTTTTTTTTTRSPSKAPQTYTPTTLRMCYVHYPASTLGALIQTANVNSLAQVS